MDCHENGVLSESDEDDNSIFNEDEYDKISFSDLSDMSDEEDGRVSDGEIRATAIVDLEATDGKSGVEYGIVSQDSPGHKKCFLKDTPVEIKIVGATYQPQSHRLNPYLYTIEIKHGIYQWTIEKRFNRFQVLHAHLDMARATIVFHDRSLEHAIKVPKLPKRPEVVVKEEKKAKRMARLEKFLQEVMAIDVYRENKHTHNFLGTSHLSFVMGYGGKEKESEVFKRVGGHNFTKSFFGVSRFDPTWHKRWLVVKHNFITYINKDTGELRDVLLFDKRFYVSCDPEKTGVEKGLLISNSTRDLTVQFFSNRLARDWMCEIAKMMSKSEYNDQTRYNSFAPVRKNSYIKGYVDGKDYFSDVADAILAAEEEIFITDWWLSPEIMLKRSVDSGPASRLDSLLKEKADQGVKIYVILYKEIEMSLGINSAYSKSALLKLNSENIKVMRHPDHVGSTSILLWAHHEKLVCIDQKKCFLGGLDLCFGRWDDHNHRLTDFGSVRRNMLGSTNQNLFNAGMHMAIFNIGEIDDALNDDVADNVNSKLFIGKDYTNPYIADVPEVECPFKDYLDRDTQQRMPWHDIACCVVGDVARDVAWHFIQRWNFTKQEKQRENKYYPFLLPKVADENLQVEVNEEGEEMCNVQLLRSASLWSCGSQIVDHSILTAYQEQIKLSKHYIYIENQFFITSLRENSVENAIGYHLVERIVRAHEEQQAFRVYVVMPLLPSFPGEIGDPASAATCFVEFWNLSSSRNIINLLKEHGIEDPSKYICFCGLRTYANLRHKKVTEIVYVHSKLMIIDDSVVIMGSANINDRSMLGVRDSELAVCAEDTKMVPGRMNGVDVLVGSFAKSLRTKIFKEHLGLLKDETPKNYRNTICSRGSSSVLDRIGGTTGNEAGNRGKYEQIQSPLANNDNVFMNGNEDTVALDEVDNAEKSCKDVEPTEPIEPMNGINSIKTIEPIDANETDKITVSDNTVEELNSTIENSVLESNDVSTNNTMTDSNDNTLCNEDENENTRLLETKVADSNTERCISTVSSNTHIETNICSENEVKEVLVESNKEELTNHIEELIKETNNEFNETEDENSDEKTHLLSADTETDISSCNENGTVLELVVDYSCGDNKSSNSVDSSEIDTSTTSSSENTENSEKSEKSESDGNDNIDIVEHSKAIDDESPNSTLEEFDVSPPIDGNVSTKHEESSTIDPTSEPTASPTHTALPIDMSDIDVTDPVCKEFWNLWRQTAKSNTEIYEEVFKCLPTKEVKSFEELAAYKAAPGLAQTDALTARARLKNIRGFLVDKPLDFLINQNLYPAAGTKESLVPTSVFT